MLYYVKSIKESLCVKPPRSLKSLDQDYSSKNHVRKFLCVFPLKWRANVTAIEESKDLATLPVDELIGNLKVYEMILENDEVTSMTTKEKVKSLTLKAKATREQTSDDSDSQGGSDEDVDEDEAESFNLMVKSYYLEEVAMLDLEIEAPGAQDKSAIAIIAGKRTNPADTVTGITSITVNGKNAYELKEKFLDDLHKNAFSGTNREDAIEHIEYIIKIVDPIDLPNVNQDKLRIVVFPILLVGDAWRCAPQLDYDDPEQINDDDMEEMDLKWQTKVKCFNCHKMGHFARDYRAKGNQDSRRRDAGYNGNKTRDNGKRPAYQNDSKALVTIDGEDIDWSGRVEEDAQNYAMMAFSSSNSGSDNEVKSCSKACEESYARLKNLYDDQRDKLGDASVEITAYTLALKKTSADESDFKSSEYASCESDSSVETSTSMLELVENASKVVCEPKVWTDAPIIEEYESDSDNDSDDPHRPLKDKGIIDSDCSRHITGNKAHLADYQEFKGGSVAFEGSNERITGKGKIKTVRLDFEDVYYVEELKHYNLFSVSQMYDKKNKKEKQHKASCKAKTVSSVNQPLQILRMDLFRPTSDETTPILKDFIRQAENQFNHKVKTIRSDNGKEFKNKELIELCGLKGIKREYKAVNTACYVLNRVLVTKPQYKTPYKLLTSKQPIISYLIPFGCHVTILNTIDQLGKFNGKSDLGFLVGYSLNSKAFRVYNLETKRVGENLHKIKLTNMQVQKKLTIVQELEKLKRQEKEANDAAESLRKEATHDIQNASTSSTNLINTSSTPLSTVGPSRAFNDGELSYPYPSKYALLDDTLMPHLKDIYASPSEGIFTDSSYDDEGVVTDFNNLETTMSVSPTPTTRIHTIHPKTQILGDPKSAVQTRSKVNKNFEAHALVSYIQKQQRNNHKDFQHRLFACFLSQIQPKKIFQALEDESWVDAMQEELLQFQIQKDERGVVVRNKAQLVAHGHRKEEGIDYDEAFAHVARIEAIRIFLAFASYMGFIIYQMDVKSAFLYGTINEEVYVSQPPGFVDPKFPNKVYKVVKALYGLHQALRAWYATLSTFLEKSGYKRRAIDKTLFIKKDKKYIMLVQVYVDDIIFGSTKKSWCDEFEELMKNMFQMSSIGELTFFLGLQVKQKEDGIYISQDKYVAKILKKFDFLSVKTASTLIETHKPLVKDEEAADVDVHLYRSMIGSLMYLTASRPDIMFTVCACSRFQATPKTSHIHAEIYNMRSSISWQETYLMAMQKQLIVATSTTEAEYVAVVHCCGQVLWIHNQLLDYVFNFMNTKIYIDNESIICIVKNPVFYSKTKHIEIRHHFIRDAYEKKLIQVLKIHIDDNVADLLTKAFDCLSAKTTSWNEFSSTMASAIICLATNQKFNFSRYILLSLVKDIEAGVPFFMFPRFVQLLIDHQLDDMSHHKDIYDNPSLTKKVFANMKRVGTGFSGVVTLLFDNILVPTVEEVGLIQDDVQSISIPTKPSTSKPHKKQKSKKQQTQAPKIPSPEPSPEHRLSLSSNDPLPGGEDSLKLKELMDLCTHLSNKVLELESKVIDIKSTYKERIEKLKGRVDRLEEENRVLKELHNVHSKVDTAAHVVENEKSFKQGRIIADIDEDVEINLEVAQAKPYMMELEHQEKVLSMQDVNDEELDEVEEVLEVVTAAKLITEVVTTAGATTTAKATKVSVPRRRRGVVIQDPEETTSTVVVHLEVQSKDKGKGILIEEPKSLKGQAQIEQDEAFARQLEAELNADINCEEY
uniref:Uncharacterized protein n=1 Tax=Tanacetum cinerariifolium TaxID=118510 RepID=A0A6L2LPR9_TANCI|nr:hypothetical protein [Tanacetum cinerariifolium]